MVKRADAAQEEEEEDEEGRVVACLSEGLIHISKCPWARH